MENGNDFYNMNGGNSGVEIESDENFFAQLFKVTTDMEHMDVTTCNTPYTSFKSQENSFNVFPIIQASAEIKNPKPSRNSDMEDYKTFPSKMEQIDETDFDFKEGAESTVPTALGLFPTASIALKRLKDSHNKKHKNSAFKANGSQSPDTSYPMQPFSSKRKRNSYSADAGELNSDFTGTLKNVSYNNRKAVRRVYLFLRNMKSHKWLLAEWFNSFLDVPILNEATLFKKHLSRMFPKNVPLKFLRFEWSYIRSVIGFRRRFSHAIVQAQRYDWERQRVIIRLLQTRSVGYVRNLEIIDGVPDKIPRVLPNGSPVQAVIRGPFRGVHIGTIISFEEPVWAYTVHFPSLKDSGDRLIPDIQLMALRHHRPLTIQSTKSTFDVQENLKLQIGDGNTVNGYPTKDLIAFLELKRITKLQKEKVLALSAFNSKMQVVVLQQSIYNKSKKKDEEKFRAWLEKILEPDFHRKYAATMLSIEKLDCALIRQMEEAENFRDELQMKMSPYNTEFNTREMINKCCMYCHICMIETNGQPIAGKIWPTTCKVLMIFKFLQTLSVTSRGQMVLKSHIESLLRTLTRESAQYIRNYFVPLLEAFIVDMEKLKVMKYNKHAKGSNYKSKSRR